MVHAHGAIPPRQVESRLDWIRAARPVGSLEGGPHEQGAPAAATVLPVQMVQLDTITDRDWHEVIAGEPQPWGGLGEELEWRERTHNFGLREDSGRLVALAGLLLTTVRVGEAELPVAGIGGVMVTRDARGQGLARRLIEHLIELAGELGAERAMLFCLPENVALYSKFGFEVIQGHVLARQPGGSVEVPMPAMWKPLTTAADWPAGRVELLDEPF